eukprot:1216099-Lingulodinium_polyedra.AAC.1
MESRARHSDKSDRAAGKSRKYARRVNRPIVLRKCWGQQRRPTCALAWRCWCGRAAKTQGEQCVYSDACCVVAETHT